MKNNKGFLLVETLITTCIIAILSTSMYIYVSNTIKNYEKRENYDNVIDVYKINNIKLYLYENWNDFDLSNVNDVKEIELNDSLKTELKVEKIFIVPNNLSSINKTDIINKTNNKAFKEYIRLLPFVGETTNYRIIVHFQNNKFASLIMKKPS